MPKDYAAQPANAVRRRDRAMDDDWIVALLERASIGTLATVHDGQPFVNGNLFVFDQAAHCIYMHTAHIGRTRANVEGDERVCFTAMEMGRLLPADTALEFSVEYAGVVVFGRAAVVVGQDEARHGLQLLLDKYFGHLRPGQHYQPIADAELARTAVYRITIESWSGKRKQAEADFPGAFLYGQAPGAEVNSGSSGQD